MPKLNKSLQAWESESFNQTLCDEIRKLGADALPLHEATSQGGFVDDSNLTISVLSAADDDRLIRVKIGAFFNEIVGGCNCADDPSPGTISSNIYCELQVIIDRSSAEADITIIRN